MIASSHLARAPQAYGKLTTVDDQTESAYHPDMNRTYRMIRYITGLCIYADVRATALLAAPHTPRDLGKRVRFVLFHACSFILEAFSLVLVRAVIVDYFILVILANGSSASSVPLDLFRDLSLSPSRGGHEHAPVSDDHMDDFLAE